MLIIDDWIDDRLEHRRFAALPPGEELDFAMLAGVIRAEAKAAGYDPDLLVQACGGDVTTYLMARQLRSVAAKGAGAELAL